MSSRFMDSVAFKVARQVPNTEIAHRFPKAMVKLLKMKRTVLPTQQTLKKGCFLVKTTLLENVI